MIGLIGAHSSGKTTLAKAFARSAGIKFIASSSSAIHEAMNIPMNIDLDFPTRLKVQTAILDAAEKQIKDAGSTFITDRTPLDMAAYMMADVRRMNILPEDQADLSAYIERCYDIVNTHFYRLILVQPGIPYEEHSGRPPLNTGYQEHHHLLCLGLLADERNEVSYSVLDRVCIGHEERLMALCQIYKGTLADLQRGRETVCVH